MSIIIKKRIELTKVVLELSLKPYATWITTILPFWYGTFFALYSIPFFSIIYQNFYWVGILLIPVIVLFCIILNFNRDFNQITLFNQKYRFNPNIDDYDYIKSPSFIVSEYFDTRFSFKLKLYGSMPMQFQGKRFALIVIKAPTITISIKPRIELKQVFDDLGDIFYLKQNYELNSSEISFVLFMQASGAVNTKDLEIYIMCEDALENFLQNYENDKQSRPKLFISKEEFYLSCPN